MILVMNLLKDIDFEVKMLYFMIYGKNMFVWRKMVFYWNISICIVIE